ncbi:unnamed protein product [Larinioides sclopetarius]|uniref:Uncharacterized protein n=1 Tax=Larinioides sclopetarius TaxID=280406 RepID=A0AAV1ZCP7_9ARAC
MEYGGVPILSLHDANRNKKHITGKGQSQWNILAPSDIIRLYLFLSSTFSLFLCMNEKSESMYSSRSLLFQKKMI